MRVGGDIPYLVPGDPRCQPRSRRSRKCPLCRGRMAAKANRADAHPAAPAGSSDDAPVGSDDPGEEPSGDGGAGDDPPDAPPAPVPALTKAQKRDLRAEARS
eukprot:188071-Alexandrium_andersonii.AAC.1